MYLLKGLWRYIDVKIEVPQWGTVMVERKKKKNAEQKNVGDKNLSEGKNYLSQLPMITLGSNIETFNEYILLIVYSLTSEKIKLT